MLHETAATPSRSRHMRLVIPAANMQWPRTVTAISGHAQDARLDDSPKGYLLLSHVVQERAAIGASIQGVAHSVQHCAWLMLVWSHLDSNSI